MDGHGADQPVPSTENPGTPIVHLLAGPYVRVGTRRQEVPEGSKQLLHTSRCAGGGLSAATSLEPYGRSGMRRGRLAICDQLYGGCAGQG